MESKEEQELAVGIDEELNEVNGPHAMMTNKRVLVSAHTFRSYETSFFYEKFNSLIQSFLITVSRVHQSNEELPFRYDILTLHCTALHCTALHCTALHCREHG